MGEFNWLKVEKFLFMIVGGLGIIFFIVMFDDVINNV